ncbi:glycosyltransferase [Aquimarina sp. 2201CG1-2-11]|uniref:glycosyltransferase n=1 Tax=Aquimarina discodermiae TaxID=3231043 RepID=UPI0034629574
MNHILIIGFVWPEPNSTAAGQRMLHLIQLFLSQNWKISFTSAASYSDKSIDLNTFGVTTFSTEINNNVFDNQIKELNPDIVVFDRYITEEQFGWKVSKHCPNALKILNTEDLHCLRKVRQEAFKNNSIFDVKRLFQSDIAKREIASIYRCDLSLMISDYELSLLQEHFKIDDSLLFYLPFLFDPIKKENKQNWPNYENRQHFVTIGNFKHEPNWNSVQYLKETIWPLIKRELPKAELHIYGAYPPTKANMLHAPKEGFLVKGWAKSASTIMSQARVCLAPLRFGAGIKGKLTEAMLNGTPSVTTNIGAEGMLGSESDWNGFITDDPDSFAKASIHLYNNKEIWKQSQQNGIEIINTRFQKEQFCTNFINTILTLQNNQTKHRDNNFIGSMLQYHFLRSTEFMSRWIEEKNNKTQI